MAQNRIGRLAPLGSLVAVAGLLAGCAELPCAPHLCTLDQWAAQASLTVDPIDHRAIFGAPGAGPVCVASTPDPACALSSTGKRLTPGRNDPTPTCC